MPGLEITTQDAGEVTVDGRRLKYSRSLRVKDYAAAATRIREAHWKGAKEAAQSVLAMTLVPGDREIILQRAYTDERNGNPVEIADVMRWFRTPAGKLFEWWLKLRTHQPEMTEDDIDETMGVLIIGLAEADEEEADPTPGA